MAYYSYYQAQPGWGQQQQYYNNQQQFAYAPPVPTYQPQPSWRGQDYYRAHHSIGDSNTMDTDVTIFDWVWGRVRDFLGKGGVSYWEARLWHTRVYGGQVDITTLLAPELGAAAGFEAYRLSNYHRNVYLQPLMDDREREEEALVGLAVAEATKLWSYCQRPADKYGRRETCEVAAATASRLFRRAHRKNKRRDRYEDFESSSSSDEDYRHGRRDRHRRRRSSASYASASRLISSPMANTGYTGAYGSNVASYGTNAGGAYGTAVGSYGSNYPASTIAYAQPTYAPQQAALTYAPAYGTPAGYVAPMVGPGGLVVPATTRTRHGSFNYPGGAYPPGY